MRYPLHDWLAAERGRAKALADHLHIPQSMVSKMARGEKQVPLDHCPAIESFTSGKVSCEALRPDKTDYFAYLRHRPGRLEQASAADAPQTCMLIDALHGRTTA